MNSAYPTNKTHPFAKLDMRVAWLHPSKPRRVDVAHMFKVSEGHLSQIIRPILKLRHTEPKAIEAKLYDLFSQEIGANFGSESDVWRQWLRSSRAMVDKRISKIDAQNRELEAAFASIRVQAQRTAARRGRTYRKKAASAPTPAPTVGAV